MRKSFLCLLLVGEFGCWSASEPAPEPRVEKGLPRTAETCVQSGDRLEVVACRRGNNLAWTVRNRSSVSLWAFVAPPAGERGAFSRDHAGVSADRGRVLLMKIEPPLMMGERVATGAVLLAPGESDRGSVPVGELVDSRSGNFSAFRVIGSPWVMSVELEVGFVEQRPLDRPHPVGSFTVLVGFQRERQQLVRTPAVPWR